MANRKAYEGTFIKVKEEQEKIISQEPKKKEPLGEEENIGMKINHSSNKIRSYIIKM